MFCSFMKNKNPDINAFNLSTFTVIGNLGTVNVDKFKSMSVFFFTNEKNMEYGTEKHLIHYYRFIVRDKHFVYNI